MTRDQQRLICAECGLAYTDERQHIDWHVDQRLRRMQRETPVSELSDQQLCDGIHAMLDRLCANNAAALRIGAEVERG